MLSSITSGITSIFHPLLIAMADVVAFFYDNLVHDYTFAIAMLTILVMLLISPLTVKQVRSQLEMQRIAPEIKRIQKTYKNDRVKLNEEMMALYREHGVNPMAGCLPVLVQLPVLYVMYAVVRGLLTENPKTHVFEPKYISHHTLLYHNLVNAHGKLMSLGFDMSKSVHTAVGSPAPYLIILVLAIGLQFLQIRQLTSRNPQAAQANAQMQKIQNFMPLVIGVLYFSFPAALNVYLVVSSLFRIGQQDLMYRYDPVISAHSKSQKSQAATGTVQAKSILKKSKPPQDSRELEAGAKDKDEKREPRESKSGERGSQPGKSRQSGTPGDQASDEAGASGGAEGNVPPKPHPRAQSKRPRKAR